MPQKSICVDTPWQVLLIFFHCRFSLDEGLAVGDEHGDWNLSEELCNFDMYLKA